MGAALRSVGKGHEATAEADAIGEAMQALDVKITKTLDAAAQLETNLAKYAAPGQTKLLPAGEEDRGAGMRATLATIYADLAAWREQKQALEIARAAARAEVEALFDGNVAKADERVRASLKAFQDVEQHRLARLRQSALAFAADLAELNAATTAKQKAYARAAPTPEMRMDLQPWPVRHDPLDEGLLAFASRPRAAWPFWRLQAQAELARASQPDTPESNDQPPKEKT